MAKKQPPQAIEAEESLLGCLLMDKAAVAKVINLLISRDFYKDKHSEIFNAVVDLFEKGEAVDVLTVSNRLDEKSKLKHVGGKSYLTELINSVPTAAHVNEYARIVQKKRILRDLIQASYEISEMGYKEEEKIDVLLDKAEEKVFSIAEGQMTQSFVPVKNTLEDAFSRIDKLSRQDGVPRGVSTGFGKLDNILAGLQKSDLILLAGRPSSGKSALATCIAKHAASVEDVPVGIFSLEMSKDQIVDRLIASEAGLDLWKLRTGRLSNEAGSNDFEKIRSALDTLSHTPIYIDDSATSNILQMRAMARRLQARKGLGLLVIDYLQLVIPRVQSDSIVRQVTEISRALKGLARELDIPVLALSQLSRAVERRSPPRPILADLRDSGCLTGDTLITRADTGERVRIDSLVGKKNIPVHSLNEDWSISKKKISKVFSSGKKKTFKLTTRSGFEIKASGNHKFRRLEDWERLDKLEVGDKIAVPEKRVKKQMTTKARWDEIKSIEPLGIEEVYDATVPDTHNFVANNIVVHNSLEQDADVVMFVYREREENSNHYKSETELIVAKHRNGPVGVAPLYFDDRRVTFRDVETRYKEEAKEGDVF